MEDEPHFGEHEPFTLGVEEELFLVDHESGRLRNVGAEVLEQLGELPRGEVKNELHRSQIELITPVCTTVGEAVEELERLRQAVLGTGVGLLACGTHPTAVEGDSQTTAKPRYERIQRILGDAGATPVCAMHIHVGMPDAETAIGVFNALRRQLPLLEALGANSPYRHGRDTGLASSRALTLRSWPRAGAPRAMADYEDFVRSTDRLTRAADVPDYTYHWWKLRPHPRLGTVEIRALDTQLSTPHRAALVALVHALARHFAEAGDTQQSTGAMAPEILDEASFRASREGVAATLPDEDGNLRPLSELVDQTLERVRPAARELGCADELEGIPALVAAGGGAGIQRAACNGEVASVLRSLLDAR
jgi:carboxylate-amine ligase